MLCISNERIDVVIWRNVYAEQENIGITVYYYKDSQSSPSYPKKG